MTSSLPMVMLPSMEIEMDTSPGVFGGVTQTTSVDETAIFGHFFT